MPMPLKSKLRTVFETHISFVTDDTKKGFRDEFGLRLSGLSYGTKQAV